MDFSGLISQDLNVKDSPTTGNRRLMWLLCVMVVGAVALVWVYKKPAWQIEEEKRNKLALEAFNAAQRPKPKAPEIDPAFHFFQDIDKSQIAARVAQMDAPFKAQPRPAGMDDDVFALCESLTDDDTSLKDLCRLPLKEIGSLVDAAFIKDGDYLVTLADKLIVWRAATGEKVREHALPLAGARQLLVGTDATTAMLVSSQALVKISLTDGKILARLDIEAGIAHAQLAFESGQLALCTQDMQCWLISENLQDKQVCDGFPLAVAKLAISPTGKFVLFFSDKVAICWNTENKVVLPLETHPIDFQTSWVMAGASNNRVITQDSVYDFSGTEPLKPVSSNNPLPYFLNVGIVQPFNTSSGNLKDALLILADRRMGTEKCLRVFDVNTGVFVGSKPAIIGQQLDQRVFASRSGAVLALLEADALRIVKRRIWVEADGNMWAGRMRALFYERRFDQLDKAAEYVRQHLRFPCNQTGEAVYTSLTHSVASGLMACESTDEYDETLKRELDETHKHAEEWKRHSMLGTISSIKRHQSIGSSARGTGFASTVTENGWKVFRERNQLAIQELSQLPEGDDWPACVYETILEVLKQTGGSFEQGDELLKEYTLKFPFETNAHETACSWSLPRWAGEPGQSGGYLRELEKLYPEPLAQPLIARVAMQFFTDQQELTRGEFGIDDKRTLKGLVNLLSKPWLTRDDLEQGMTYADTIAKTPDSQTCADRYMLDHDVVGYRAYNNKTLKLLRIWRERSKQASAEGR